MQSVRAEISARPPLLTPGLMCVFASMFLALTNFYLLFSALPVIASAAPGGGNAAGTTTGMLMAATVAAEFFVPGLVARLGYRRLAIAGLILLGGPTLLLCVSMHPWLLAAVSVMRGAGLAIVFVIGSPVVTLIVPHARRAEALGLYGVMAGAAAILALPAGTWIAAHFSPYGLFLFSGAMALAGLFTVSAIPGNAPPPSDSPTILRTFFSPELTKPAALFAISAMVAGACMAFVPIVLSRHSSHLIAPALLIHSTCTMIARGLCGRFAARVSNSRLLAFSLAISGVGTALLAGMQLSPLALGGAALTGLGFGAAQNASLALMFERAPASSYDAASAIWSIAYDAGLGAGAVGFELLATSVGNSIAFAMSGALVVLAMITAPRLLADSRVSAESPSFLRSTSCES